MLKVMNVYVRRAFHQPEVVSERFSGVSVDTLIAFSSSSVDLIIF